jgi:hypothetical protein
VELVHQVLGMLIELELLLHEQYSNQLLLCITIAVPVIPA